MKVYVASSWRNQRYAAVVQALRAAFHEVYDFRNPPVRGDGGGFHWSEIDPKWQQWTPVEFRKALNHPLAVEGYGEDLSALSWAEACVLVMPCGRSAHLELGYAIGARKRTIILLSDGEPELMYRMASYVCLDLDEVLARLEE